ncbi:MAG: hypothetical protein LH650_09415 [Chloroflexi bacterium]|nr:hypothetical protein [Chloroflexota bacterium]
MGTAHIRSRALGALVAVPLVFVAASASFAQSPEASMAHMGPLPAWSVALSGLESGATVTDNQVTVNVAPNAYTFSCADAGKANVDGVGHYHTILDGALVDMECTPTATISMQNVVPGPHSLIVVPALDDHEEIQAGAAMVDFTYAPTSPLPEIAAAATTTPTVSIVSPAPGTEVSGDFTVRVSVTDYTLSEDLFGKANVPGYGHWHLNVDSTTGPMMGMMTMLGMSGSDTFQASTQGLTPGPHTFFAILVDNQHAPLMPEVIAQVDLVVK